MPRAMGVIPAAIVTAPTPERRDFVHSSRSHDARAGPSSYGAVNASTSTESSPGSRKGKEPAVGFTFDHDHEHDYERGCDSESCDSDDGMEPLVDSESR